MELSALSSMHNTYGQVWKTLLRGWNWMFSIYWWKTELCITDNLGSNSICPKWWKLDPCIYACIKFPKLFLFVLFLFLSGTLRVQPGASDTFVAYELTSPISRINKPGFTGQCMEKTNPGLAKFCFCKEYLGLPIAFMGASEKEDKVVSHSVWHALYPGQGPDGNSHDLDVIW